MKRITSLKTVAVLVMLLSCLTLQAVNAITYTATYSPDKLTTGTDTLGGVTYSTVAYEGLFNGGAPGTPSLPVDYLKFSVPWNATNFTVTANLSNSTLVSLGYMVYPNQQPRLMSDTTGWSITLPDSIAYLPNVYHPSNSNSAWVVDEGFLAGENHIVTVAVMPVAYYHRRTTNADRKMIRLSQSIDITLSYDLSDSLAMYPIIRQNTALRSEGYRLTQSLVVNPANVVNDAPTSMTPDTLIVINPGSGVGGGLRYEIDSTAVYYDTLHITPSAEQMAEYQYLIVTTPEFKHSVRRLAALKRQKGYTVKVVTMDEVSSHPYVQYGDLIKQTDGTYLAVDTTSTGKLRQFLKMYYNNYGTEYVLFVGNGVPYKYIPLLAKPESEYDSIAPSDIYYSDLNNDWSEMSFHDFGAELYVGRILSTNENQIQNYTDKLLRYELNPGDGNYSYLKKALFSEGREFPGELSKMKRNFSSCYPYNIIMNDNEMGSPTGKNIIDTINNNPVSFISIFNHGDSIRIRVYGDNKNNYSSYFIYSANSLESGNGLNSLSNKYYPTIFYSLSCTTVPYDYNGISFGEAFTTGLNYGGPVFIGYTRKTENLGIEELSYWFSWEITNGYPQMCQSNALSKMHAGNRFNNAYYQEAIENAYIGDPVLEMWTDEPQVYSNIVITRGDDTITVSGLNPDSTSIVSVCDYTNKITKKRVLAESIIFNQVSPNSSIMLYRHDYIPYIAPMVLQNVTLNNSQYVIASDVTAGHSVDSERTNGNVIVQNGTEYEIEASGTVTLHAGFSVEPGATFAVYPSSF